MMKMVIAKRKRGVEIKHGIQAIDDLIEENENQKKSTKSYIGRVKRKIGGV